MSNCLALGQMCLLSKEYKHNCFTVFFFFSHFHEYWFFLLGPSHQATHHIKRIEQIKKKIFYLKSIGSLATMGHAARNDREIDSFLYLIWWNNRYSEKCAGERVRWHLLYVLKKFLYSNITQTHTHTNTVSEILITYYLLRIQCICYWIPLVLIVQMKGRIQDSFNCFFAQSPSPSIQQGGIYIYKDDCNIFDLWRYEEWRWMGKKGKHESPDKSSSIVGHDNCVYLCG